MSALWLKIIAYTTMLIDHLAAAVGRSHPALFKTGLGAVIGAQTLYSMMRGIGRIAFPIFIFQIIEGVRHTDHPWRYLSRIAVLAVISEVPFDLALFGQWFTWDHQNVYFTLLLGLIFCLVFKWALSKSGTQLLGAGLIALGTLILALALSLLMKTDYSYKGVAAIALMAVLLIPKVDAVRGYPQRQFVRLAIFFVAIGVLSVLSGGTEYYALFAAIPVFLYNEEKGYNKVVQYVFYAFYPVHLFVIGILIKVL